MRQQEIFGQLMSVREVYRYLNGSGQGKGTPLGEKMVRKLLKSGEIPHVLKCGRMLTLKSNVDAWLSQFLTRGSKVLGIEVPRRNIN